MYHLKISEDTTELGIEANVPEPIVLQDNESGSQLVINVNLQGMNDVHHAVCMKDIK